MKPRDAYNIVATTGTAAFWSFMTVVLVTAPMVLLGVPRRVAVTLAIGATLLTSVFTAFGAYRLNVERERRSKGQCIRCGTDVQNATERCPKCGKRIGRRVNV